MSSFTTKVNIQLIRMRKFQRFLPAFLPGCVNSTVNIHLAFASKVVTYIYIHIGSTLPWQDRKEEVPQISELKAANWPCFPKGWDFFNLIRKDNFID